VKVWIDPEACVGHGRCYAVAPDVFDADDQGHGLVRLAAAPNDLPAGVPVDVPPELEAAARTGAANCPESAILITD